jgi:hypothetical protein
MGMGSHVAEAPSQRQPQERGNTKICKDDGKEAHPFKTPIVGGVTIHSSAAEEQATI